MHEGQTLSDARSYLEPQSFTKVLDEANFIVKNWNQLLKEIRKQKKKIQLAGLDESALFSAEIPHRFSIIS
jgi:hypothetical protein